LREALLAVIPQGSGERGEKCGRGIVAHAPVGFFAMDESGKKNLNWSSVQPEAPATRLGSWTGTAGETAVALSIRCGMALRDC